MTAPPGDEIFAPFPVRRRKRAALGLVLGALLIALVSVAAGALGWLARDGRLVLPFVHAAPLAAPASAPALSEARVAALEARLAALNANIDKAAANAAPLTTRTEGLFTAFAARRAIERGMPLGYLEGLLRQHFAASQPRAVNLLIDSANAPVTRDMLLDQLQTLAPALAGRPPVTMWDRLSKGFSGLLTLRREAPEAPAPASRIDHAVVALREGRIDLAIADVQRLPASAARNNWLTEAQHAQASEAALDVLETAALAATSPAAKPAPGNAGTKPPGAS